MKPNSGLGAGVGTHLLLLASRRLTEQPSVGLAEAILGVKSRWR
jgi:hypothetical protein